MGIFGKIFGKNQPIKSYQDFWTWFLEHEKSFFKAVQKGSTIEKDFFERISAKLNELRDGYYFLVGMLNENTAELILTADGTITNMVFVEELVNASPKIDNWKFTAHKPSLDIENVNIEMGGYTFNRDNLFFYSNDFPEYPDEIDITVVYADSTDVTTEITNGVYIFLDNFLGEVDVVTTIDNLTVASKSEPRRIRRTYPGQHTTFMQERTESVNKEFIPIEKLKSFLIWRQKEFVEKYESVRYDSLNDNHLILESKSVNGNPMVAVINSDALKWDRKASHPWIVSIDIKYASTNNGMPGNGILEVLNDMEDKMLAHLIDDEGYIYVGRETAECVRAVYFACKEFKKPSKVLDQIRNEFSDQFEISFEIYKDKYWRSFERFMSA